MQSDSTSTFINNSLQLSRPIAIFGFVAGLILSLGVLSGDDAGRVNLLYLLLVYLFVPLIGAVISIVSLLKGKGLNVARLLSALPVWTKAQQSYLLTIRKQGLHKRWFFLQSQVAALFYAIASFLTFLILLLATDINFVWRSTLLEAEQLLPTLQFIALPWAFWEAAQPSLELLRMTQDSRLSSSYTDSSSFGQWWAFILATQITYSFLLRGLLLFIAKLSFGKNNKDNEQQIAKITTHTSPRRNTKPVLSDITHSLPEQYALCNWAAFKDNIIQQLALSPRDVIATGPVAESGHPYDGHQVFLVKAWEPPMGEIFDYMQSGKGVLYPINLAKNKLCAPETKHLQEWQRFVADLPEWSVYLPTSLSNEMDT